MLKLRMADRNILDHYTDLPVGEVLRRARLQYELEIPHVCARLNIRPEHIEAIETGNIARLPGRVYAIGFVRAYANYLQLDTDKIVYLFKSQCIGHTANRDLKFPTPVRESRSPAWWMVAASIGVVAVIAVLLLSWGRSAGAPEVSPALPDPVAEQSMPSSAAPGKLKITAKETSWVELRAGEKVLISRVLAKGESFTAPDVSDLRLSTGNAEGIGVTWDGRAVDVFEGRKGIVRDLPVSGLSAYKAGAAE